MPSGPELRDRVACVSRSFVHFRWYGDAHPLSTIPLVVLLDDRECERPIPLAPLTPGPCLVQYRIHERRGTSSIRKVFGSFHERKFWGCFILITVSGLSGLDKPNIKSSPSLRAISPFEVWKNTAKDWAHAP